MDPVQSIVTISEEKVILSSGNSDSESEVGISSVEAVLSFGRQSTGNGDFDDRAVCQYGDNCHPTWAIKRSR